MVILGGWVFLMSEVPLYLERDLLKALLLLAPGPFLLLILCALRRTLPREKIVIELMTSDRKLKASGEGSK